MARVLVFMNRGKSLLECESFRNTSEGDNRIYFDWEDLHWEGLRLKFTGKKVEFKGIKETP